MHQDVPFRFAANLKWLFTELPFERRFEAAAAEGFRGVEFPSPYEYSPSELRKRLSDAGLQQVLINTPQGPAGSPTASGLACIPGLAQEFRDGIDKGLEYAAELGCGLLHVVAGIRPDDVSRDRAFAQYVANIAWAAERARGTGVRLVLEAQNHRNAPRFFLESQAQAAAVVEAVGEDVVGLLFDVFHVQVDEGDVTQTLERFFSLVSHIQIADAPHRTRPGSGELSWPYVFERISASGYAGWIGCEFTPANDSAGNLAALEELTAR